jgi:hypothetical protein
MRRRAPEKNVPTRSVGTRVSAGCRKKGGIGKMKNTFRLFFLILLLSTACASLAQDSTGTVVTINEKVGPVIDSAESRFYRIFKGLHYFRSAELVQKTDGSHAFRITEANPDSGAETVRWVSVDNEGIERLRKYITEFDPEKFKQDSIFLPERLVRLRFAGQDSVRNRAVGTVVSLDESTIRIRVRGRASPQSFILDSLISIEVCTGQTRKTGSRAFEGGAIGLIAGALIGYVSLHSGPPYSDGDLGGFGLIIGGGAGLLGGLLVGSAIGNGIESYTWQEMPIPYRNGVPRPVEP